MKISKASRAGRGVVVAVVAACGGSPPPTQVGVAKAPDGSLTQTCNGVAFWASSGNAAGACHAVVDDVTGRLRAMTCDDGHRDAATLACSADGHVTCASAGTGVCANDATLVRPSGNAAARIGYFAMRCNQQTFFVALAAARGGARGECLPTFDRATGTTAMHCDDGAGDTAEFVCRDGIGACTFTGTGVCTSDETVVRR
jgi:hypothetical protein